MGKVTRIAAAILAVGVIGGAVAFGARPADAGNGTIEFDEAEVFTEINATDGDAGFHLSVDGEDWQRVRVYGPDGKRIFDVKGHRALHEHGVTGLMFESAEPGFDDLSLQEFQDRFPEGTYTFRGRTVDGDRLVGETEFTHDFPAAPLVTNPAENGVLDLSDPVVRWEPVPPPNGSPIISYQVIVSREDPGYSFEIELAANATSMTVPDEFLAPGEAYKVEVLAKEASGNQTITEVPFTTGS